MPVFVNLPLSYAARQPEYIEIFISRRVCPELGMDTYAVQSLPEAWHRETAARFRQAGLACAVHLPFFDLSPGSLNDAVLDATRATLRRAAELAALYAPQHFVGHPHYNRGEHEPRAEEWLRRGVQTWLDVLEQVPDVPLFLENTHERALQPILNLLDMLPAARTGLCLDVGHWHAFAQGWRNRDLAEWLELAGARLRHLHLHDNDGSDDQHAGLGAGSIPLEELFGVLAASGVRPSATLEPHDEGAFETSLAVLEQRGDWVAALRTE